MRLRITGPDTLPDNCVVRYFESKSVGASKPGFEDAVAVDVAVALGLEPERVHVLHVEGVSICGASVLIANCIMRLVILHHAVTPLQRDGLVTQREQRM